MIIRVTDTDGLWSETESLLELDEWLKESPWLKVEYIDKEEVNHENANKHLAF